MAGTRLPVDNVIYMYSEHAVSNGPFAVFVVKIYRFSKPANSNTTLDLQISV